MITTFQINHNLLLDNSTAGYTCILNKPSFLFIVIFDACNADRQS